MKSNQLKLKAGQFKDKTLPGRYLFSQSMSLSCSAFFRRHKMSECKYCSGKGRGMNQPNTDCQNYYGTMEEIVLFLKSITPEKLLLDLIVGTL